MIILYDGSQRGPSAFERERVVHPHINPVALEYLGLTSDDGVSLIKLIKCVLKFF